MLEWEHFKEPSVVTVFLALLLSAERDGRADVNLGGLMSLTGLSHNTVTGAIAKLVKSGEITREKQGHKIYTTITNWSEYQDKSLTQNLGERDNSLTQNLGEQEQPVIPKNGSTIYNKNNNKTNNKNNCVDTRTHEEFIANALNDLRVEQGCMAMRITPEQYRQLVTEVTNDWIYRQLPDDEWTLTHLLAQMRIKHNINNRNNGNNGNNTQSSSADSIRAKLDADAVKAMAALAAEIGKPKVVPF